MEDLSFRNRTTPNGWYGWHEVSYYPEAPTITVFVMGNVIVTVLDPAFHWLIGPIIVGNLFWIAGQEPLKAESGCPKCKPS